MRKTKLIEDYSGLLSDDVSAFARNAVRQTAGSHFIKDGYKLTIFLNEAVELLDTYLAYVATASHPTPAQTAQCTMLCTGVVRELNHLAKCLNLDYTNNERALLSSGLTLAIIGISVPVVPRPTVAAEAAIDFELLDGPQPGCLLVRLRRPANAMQNLLRYSVDELLPEEYWPVAVAVGDERQLGPFPSGTRVLVKGAGLTGTTLEPQYSPVQSRVVQ
jgi:hypothetical protein